MRRAVAAAAAALALLWAGCGGEGEPREDRAARLVPADALAYVHVDLGDERLARHVGRLPWVGRLVAGLGALAGEDVERWRGDEAALALLDSGRPAADTLLLVEVADRRAAQGAVRSGGGVEAALAGDFLAVGQPRVVERAVALARARRGGLERTVSGAVDAWMPDTGLRRVLEGQAGIVGALGGALDDPRLRSVTATVTAEDDGLRVELVRARRGSPPASEFEPSLLDRVPADAAGYLGLAGARPLVDRLSLGGLDLGEVALWVQPAVPAPVVTAVAEVRDERAARDAVGRALGRLADALDAGAGAGAGRIAQLEQREVGGMTASVLPLSAGVELSAAVHDGLLLVSTDPAALARARAEAAEPLRETDAFERVVEEVPDAAEALAFADLAQLLTLGDRAGLGAGQAAGTARDDLRSIRAFGAVAERRGSDTTAELFFEIP